MSAQEIKIAIAYIALSVAAISFVMGIRALRKLNRLIRDIKARGPIEGDQD